MEMITADYRRRICETEYATVDAEHVRAARFGTFYSHPDFRDRFDANQLCRVSCVASEVHELLSDLERCYEDLDLGFRKVSGYEPEVWQHLGSTLRSNGWGVWTSTLMLHSETSRRQSNPTVEVRSVGPRSADLEALYRAGGVLDRGFALARAQFRRLGGEYLVGYLDGQPACCAGWYVADRVARFRHVLTAPWARGRGCATTLIHHVQQHPVVLRQDGLVILVTADGPQSLYSDLGFRHVALFWEAKVALA